VNWSKTWGTIQRLDSFRKVSEIRLADLESGNYKPDAQNIVHAATAWTYKDSGKMKMAWQRSGWDSFVPRSCGMLYNFIFPFPHVCSASSPNQIAIMKAKTIRLVIGICLLGLFKMQESSLRAAAASPWIVRKPDSAIPATNRISDFPIRRSDWRIHSVPPIQRGTQSCRGRIPLRQDDSVQRRRLWVRETCIPGLGSTY
jgi:hypothetical protein